MNPHLLRILAGGLALVLVGCNGAIGPDTSRMDRLPPGCNSPVALAIAIRNESQDSPNDRRRLPC